MRAIEKHLLPLGFDLPQPNRDVIGGYFVWLSLPSGLAANALSRRCRTDQDVIVAPGTLFEVPNDDQAAGFDGHIRLCFAWEEQGKLEEGIRRVGSVAGKMIEEMGHGGSTRASEDYVLVHREGPAYITNESK